MSMSQTLFGKAKNLLIKIYIQNAAVEFKIFQIPLVFKGSFKKANRSRIDSFTGIGDEKALKILGKVSQTFDVPTLR